MFQLYERVTPDEVDALRRESARVLDLGSAVTRRSSTRSGTGRSTSSIGSLSTPGRASTNGKLKSFERCAVARPPPCDWGSHDLG